MANLPPPMYSPHGVTEVILTRRQSYNGTSAPLSDFALRPARNSYTGSSVNEFAPAIVSTAGVVYDSIHVMDKAVVSHGTVYYLLHVASHACPLESYTIRRRYNDFKSFHAALSRYMRPAPFALFKPPSHNVAIIDEDRDYMNQLHHEEDIGGVFLPPMPPGGLISIITSKETLVRSRIAQFNRILQAALDDASPEVADALRSFIKEAPGGPMGSSRHCTSSFLEASAASSVDRALNTSSSYVSLRDYVVPELCMKLEREARRRSASGTRFKQNSDDFIVGTSFASRDSTTSTSSACIG
ncbi:unnamed protein product [Aphanomyces euteiches]|uniref:PX domain-containing protein n=1 Tax=Aphanomyces euteiches TaxID=100861 RepID=A0A6G0W5H1_9STRA|nr:hypothetical protein Ae201684_018431 [Aphanomyces euteiches]KAH9076251.1 hypothetical protein Ae201684P_012739 [Aphanomyces euteiches]KAH9110224.1 hypothetical protein AeMF1_014920 [Aphanomyces euteiches]KAH9130610.1 hypothetical protein LEN26_008351 [Aphanomyces euteiches]KAH9146787.1 hypothetical protein AeRB84_009371 [Aphanomyces euteiches]